MSTAYLSSENTVNTQLPLGPRAMPHAHSVGPLKPVFFVETEQDETGLSPSDRNTNCSSSEPLIFKLYGYFMPKDKETLGRIMACFHSCGN